MTRIQDYNPFAKRSEYTSNQILAYKICIIVSWSLVVIFGILYTFKAPSCGEQCNTIWGQNWEKDTPFSLNSVVSSLYWIALLGLQANYLRFLWSADSSVVNPAAGVGSHFVVHNLLTFGFIMCWVRGEFWPGELLLVVNLFNLTALYFRHSTYAPFVHIPIVSGPYAWTIFAIFWDGAAMVGARDLAARIVANVFIWSLLLIGGFFVLVFWDYSMGFEFTILSLSLALGQIATKAFALQWIFAFVIMGVMLVLSLLVYVPSWFGRSSPPELRMGDERAPLLSS